MAALRFVSAGAAQGLVASVARAAGIAVEGSFGAVGAQLEKFRAGEPCDVVILTAKQIAELASRDEVDAATVADLGAVPTSIAVRAADATPAVADGDALRAALLAADAIYFPDPAKATAGIHFAKVLEQLGIHEQVRERLRTFPNGSTAMRNLAQASGAPIGCTQSTEILATPGVKLVAPLPKGYDLETVYTAAVSARAAHREAAAAFVRRLVGEPARATRTAAGFRGFAIRPAVAADADAIRAVIQAVLPEFGLPSDPAGTDRDLAGIPANYLERGGTVDVVADSAGRIVGCCAVYPMDAATCELRKMYLLPAARGHGLGQRLLARALAFARGRGFQRMELETASVLTDAIALYQRAGFAPIARKAESQRCDQAFALALK